MEPRLQPVFMPASMPEILFDANGMGACDFARKNEARFGQTVQMRPATFLKLASSIGVVQDPSYVQAMMEEISVGRKLAHPYLLLAPHHIYEDDAGSISYAGQWQVIGHEGRHRCQAILSLAKAFDQSAPLVPVTLYAMHRAQPMPLDAQDVRAINFGMLPQDEETHVLQGPLFVQPIGAGLGLR